MRHAIVLGLLAACGSTPSASSGGPDAPGNPGGDGNVPIDSPTAAGPRTVFVIPLENKSSVQVYGDTTDAPYLNGLMSTAAYARKFSDELAAGVPSEPHYVWMEAGTNKFTDKTFTSDSDPSATNSTASTDHLVTQLMAAGRTWTAYQEDITSGTCPIATSGVYAPKHDPFIFFKDIVGATPSATNATCGAHHKAITELATDLQNGTVPNYAFITPNLCHDMHGDLTCPSLVFSAQNVAAGDTWLSTNLPPLIEYTHTHDAIIMLTWDEGDTTTLMPFMAIGDHVIPGPSDVAFSHSSQLKTIEEFLGVPVLPKVATANDFAPLFTAGYITP